jgi:hypothetical protein
VFLNQWPPANAHIINNEDKRLLQILGVDERIVLKWIFVRGPFANFVDWRQCAAVMQRGPVTVMPNCSGGGNVVVV